MQFMHYSATTKKHGESLHQKTRRTLLFGFGSAVLLVGLMGCQTSNKILGQVDDGSLQYTESKQLEPLKLPASQQTAPFVPLYPVPAQGVNTLTLENKSGKRYELPAPYRKVSAVTE